MAEETPLFNQTLGYSAKRLRQMLAMLLGGRLFTDLTPSVSLNGGGGHGIVGLGDLVVTERAGTTNMSVDVAAGSAFIRSTQAADQGVYGGMNNAPKNVPISTAHGTNPRKDLVVAQVRDSSYGGANDDLLITVIAGTPAASPVDPSVPEDALVLARVDVPALDTAITNSQITDLRPRAAALGGRVGDRVMSQSTTTQVGGSGADFTYGSASITLGPGRWELEAGATLANTLTNDSTAVGIWNVTTGALVSGSVGVSGNTGVGIPNGLRSLPVVIDVTAPTVFAPRCIRNGGSAITASAAAGGPAGFITAYRIAA